MENVMFEKNWARSEGPAVSTVGTMETMKNVSFSGNFFTCESGMFLEYLPVS